VIGVSVVAAVASSIASIMTPSAEHQAQGPSKDRRCQSGGLGAPAR
jgi:hypothetical protein